MPLAGNTQLLCMKQLLKKPDRRVECSSINARIKTALIIIVILVVFGACSSCRRESVLIHPLRLSSLFHFGGPSLLPKQATSSASRSPWYYCLLFNDPDRLVSNGASSLSTLSFSLSRPVRFRKKNPSWLRQTAPCHSVAATKSPSGY